ncbi:cytidine deaminase [Fodinisporobacter ferrooxydans]
MQKLAQAALNARAHAYVPYSHFPVGAALALKSGEIVTGCNIENASFGLTNCAERTAIFKAISEGKSEIEGIVVVADTSEPVSPCGACRQVMVEFCPKDTQVRMMNLRGDLLDTTVGELLPGAFTKEDMDIREDTRESV